ncbi:MAG: LuxE/PaaK family acyltransferase [Promethearchaeota archaeon]
MLIDDLINRGKKDFLKDNQDEVINNRFKSIIETTRHQFEKCRLYRQFCKQKNFDPRRDLKNPNDINKIPYLTTANFKRDSGKPKEFLCVPESEIQVYTLSSGTSGDPSMIGRDIINLRRFFKMFDFLFESLWNFPTWDWSFMFAPPDRKAFTIDEKIEQPMHHMGYIFNVENKAPFEKRNFALKLADEESRKQGKPFEFDPQGTFGFFGSNPSKMGAGWIGGSIPLIYLTLTEYYQKTGQTFDLGENCVLMAGGGWKTYKGQAVTPEKFRDDINKILNIPKEQIFDVYSFTETDCVFGECEHHNKHSLPWQDIIVRDVETLEPVEIGEKGLMNVINPIAYSYAGVSILQDDIIRISMIDDCPCGRKGKIVEVIGRAEGVEAKGCGAQIAEDTKTE